jgi:DNA-binding LytR/AlgR family response regulator
LLGLQTVGALYSMAMTLLQSFAGEIEAKEKVVEVQTAEGTFLAGQTLDILEQRLDTREFLRPQWSYIVRTRVSAELGPWFSGSYILKLDHGTHVPVA